MTERLLQHCVWRGISHHRLCSGGPSGCAYRHQHFGRGKRQLRGLREPYWQSLVGVPNDHVRDIPTFLCLRPMVSGPLLPICYTDPNFGGSALHRRTRHVARLWRHQLCFAIMAGIQLWLTKSTDARANPNQPIRDCKRGYGWKGSAACNSSNGNTVGSGCVFTCDPGDMDVNCTATQIQSGHKTVLPPSTAIWTAPPTACFPLELQFTNGICAGTGWDFATGIGTGKCYTWCSAPGGGRPVFA